ncbi:MAG: MotA/TolQ/ExbB proton channel family protein [Spirochaetales bacterium]|nr:MotA/TolQ/ExbB proton channel family protein [Spirochaetales bacterium]
MFELLDECVSYMAQGGFVMWPLLVCTVMLWYSLGYRFVHLKRGAKEDVRTLAGRFCPGENEISDGYIREAVAAAHRVWASNLGSVNIHGRLDDAFSPILESMSRYRGIIHSVVIIAPLLGLLGTVTGMIEMFDSLAEQTFYSQTGGVANGIAEALFTTQFGLLIAIPGLIAGRILDRREDRMKKELVQIKDIFAAGKIKGGMA